MGLHDIPLELREQPSWVCSRSTSKVPLETLSDRPASSSNPRTWGKFEDAVGSVECGFHDYVGYVFHNTGIVGIDVDRGFENGLLTPLGIDILTKCHSYTELSKSGRGFHVFIKGKLPFEGRNNRQGVEMYCNKRYFIMTGRQYMFDTIIENQEAIDYLVKKYMTTESETHSLSSGSIYQLEFGTPHDGVIPIAHIFPPIGEGGRNISLTSLGGQLATIGYPSEVILDELMRANREACDPPLPEWEVRSIFRSISRYRRD